MHSHVRYLAAVSEDRDGTRLRACERAEPAHGRRACRVAARGGDHRVGVPLTRVLPLVGRPLQPADELQGAEAVEVLGYDVWQRQFLQDPAIIGRQPL